MNRAVLLGARLGRDIDGVRELEVRGRRTGKPRRTPLKVVEVGRERYVVSLQGSSGWVRNLRSARTARLRFGREVEEVLATEIADEEKRRIALAYLATGSREETRQRLAWAAEGVGEEDARRGAATVPMFRLSPRGIRPPRSDELEALRSIERDAGRAFAAIGMADIAADEPPTVAELEAARAAGRLFVAVDGTDRPVAYLVSAVVDGCAHVEQVSVASAHAGQGLGAMLIDHLGALALADRRPALTLTTFRDVPWNAPYYRRLGFLPIDPAEHGPELAALVAREAASIPSDAPRVAMRRLLKPR